MSKGFKDQLDKIEKTELYRGRKALICPQELIGFTNKLTDLKLVTIIEGIEQVHKVYKDLVIGLSENGDIIYGNVVYLLNEDGYVITKKGLKDLNFNMVSGKIKVFFVLNAYQTNKYVVDVSFLLVDILFENKTLASEYINSIKPNLKDFIIGNGYIEYKSKKKVYKINDFYFLKNNKIDKDLTMLSVYDELNDFGELSPKSKKTYGREYLLKPKGFYLKVIE